MSVLETLLVVYTVLLAINAIISVQQWFLYRSKPFKLLIGVWVFTLVNFILQGLDVETKMFSILAFSTYIFAALCLTGVMCSIANISFNYRRYCTFYCISLVAATGLYYFTHNFTLAAIPVALSLAAPQLVVSLTKLCKYRENGPGLSNTFAFVLLLNGLHFLDYPFLREQAESAVFGFGAVLIFACIFSALLPTIVSKHHSDNEKKARIKAQNDILRLKELANRELERSVFERTEELARVQASLVQKEKLASLGALVAGVAHELNTPVGNGLVVVSSLLRDTKKISSLMNSGISRSELEQYLQDVEAGIRLAQINLEKTSELVLSFKQVAVDRASAQRRRFDLSNLLEETRITLATQIKQTPYVLDVEDAGAITLDSYPGPLGQVLTNLVNNGILHGLHGRENGKITIKTSFDKDSVKIEVLDDGVGIEQKHLPHIFDPFFTTKLGQGGSGLGLHIVHNTVFAVLGGTVEVDSKLGFGTRFVLNLPMVAPSLEKGRSRKVATSAESEELAPNESIFPSYP